MKLYSGKQLIIFCIVSAAAAFLLSQAVGFLGGGTEEADIFSSAEDTAADQYADNAFVLETNELRSDDIRPVFDRDQYGEEELENIDVYQQKNRAVVNITTETLAYNWFLEPVPQEGSTGSGSIIDKRGYVLTNYHVVENANKVYITLADGDQVEGDVIGIDPENDLAVLKFDPRGRELITIPMGDSSDLHVGQKVLAIGNPFALDRTLTTGIVSGLGRPLETSNGTIIRDMIQTDASINPGNSGGPLLDSKGNMIGINTMIYSPSGGSIGIGFAVPVNTARRVVPDLIEYGYVKRGWIDIIPVQLFPQLVRYAELPVNKGILVSRVIANGNAAKAGIQGGDSDKPVRWGRSIIYLGGDVIVEVDNTKVDSLQTLYEALEDNKPGEKVPVTVIRNNRRMEYTVTLSERPQQSQIY